MFDVPARSPLRLEAGQARVDVRPENAEIVGFPSLVGQIEVANGQHDPRTWLRTRQNAGIEETEFVSWVVVRLGTGRLGNVGLPSR